jgi:general secretion pathway protein G
MTSLNCRRGFTLIEVLVVAAIIGVLAGVLVPMIFDRVEEAKVARAEADIKNIASSVLLFHRDTGTWPYSNTNSAPRQHFERLDSSNARDPVYEGASWPSGDYDSFYDHLTVNTHNYPNWRGPYLERVEADPWGNEYRMWVRGFTNDNEHAWIVCAGPDGVIETDESETSPKGDDIAIMLK